MNKLIPIALGLSLVIGNSQLPVMASPLQQNCNKTLTSVRRSLVKVVMFKQRALGNQGQPRGRSKALDITLDVSKFSPSEATQKSLATKVIKNCSKIASVSFSANQTDGGNIYGLKNNKIIKFSCVEYRGVEMKLNWGEYYCQ
jgi:hypothetical protein